MLLEDVDVAWARVERASEVLGRLLSTPVAHD